MMVRKCELRQKVAENANRTKNKMLLEKLAVISDLFRKKYDEEDYGLLSEAEHLQVCVISDVLQLQDPRHLRSVRTIINNLAK